MMKEITRYAQQGFTAAANDECMIALQQDTAAMGAAMGDAREGDGRSEQIPCRRQDRLGGAAAGSRARSAATATRISAFSKQDPDTAVPHHRHLRQPAEHAGRGAGLMVPPRTSLLDDPELKAATASIPRRWRRSQTALPSPALPEFYAVGEFITRRILQAVTGEMAVKPALDAAADETEDFLKGHGYYQ